eukprot:TRINITY_DN340_c2_g1_i1.p3 TRINITY_DN340_c2_g1~~TRINITY_DN340_c2_g1_i1.p3  ORF type:complete len:647 (-),score=133.67 TRINITY_DN340_c2_g1_i1:10552-12492(-)
MANAGNNGRTAKRPMSAKAPPVLPRAANFPHLKPTIEDRSDWYCLSLHGHLLIGKSQTTSEAQGFPQRTQAPTQSSYPAPRCTFNSPYKKLSRGSTFEKKRPKIIGLDKESLYDSTIQLKKSLNHFKEENDKLRAKLQQYDEESMKKNKLLQEMVSQLATSASVPKLTRSHKEASLVIALKQKIKELETENVELKNANMTIKKNIRLTKHYENDVANKTLEEECKRLRLMLEELINEKHVGSPSEYAELEGKMLEQKAIIKELKIKNLELSQELSRARDSERQILERIKEYEVQEQKVHREKQKVKRQRQEINEARERIAALENEKEELKAKIEELQSAETRREHDTSQIDVIEKLNSNIEKLKLEKEELKRRADASERKILEINREMREERNKAKEKEEEYTLKMLEERERLNQRIVRLDRELSAKSKELAENDKKVKEVETVKSLGAVREITKPAVQDKDLVHTKQWIKLVLLRYKKGLNELKEELFAEYKGEERISIKELTKIFQRPALSLPLMQAEDLSRYLIEPKDQPMVVYNKYSDKVMVEIRIKLDSFLSIDYPKDFYEKIQEATESAIDKIKDRFRYMKSSVEDVALENGKVELVQWLRICKDMFPGLTSLEKDCLIALMVTEQEDVKQLKFSVNKGK